MGKVGSTSIHVSLAKAKLPNPTYDVHFLTDRSIENWAGLYAAAGLSSSMRSRHVFIGRSLARRIRNDEDIPWLVVTGVRDPVARVISSVFQIADWHLPHLVEDGHVDTAGISEYIVAQLTDLANGTVPDWFDIELKTVFGIDVYEHPFDWQAGYQIIQVDGVRVLVYRVEDLNRIFAPAMQQLLEIDDAIGLVSSNIGAEKPYREDYEAVRRNLRLPSSLCDAIYGGRAVRHFYQEEYVQRLIGNWSK